jgi:T1SS-143 domain-containing protein
MTNTFDTSNTTQECKANATEYHVEMPCAGSNAAVSLSTQEPTVFNFGLNDIAGMQIIEGGMLLITFQDGQTLTIENFGDALANSEFQNIELSDGEVINLASLEQGLGGIDSTQNMIDVASVESEIEVLDEIAPAAGDEFVVLPEEELTELLAETEEALTGEENNAEMSLEDGIVINADELIETTSEENTTNVEVTAPQPVPVRQAQPPRAPEQDETAFLSPEELAAIEVAAGDTTPAGALGNTGAGFGSSVTGIGLGQIDDVGPIGPTALQFDRPELRDDVEPVIVAAAGGRPVGNPIVVANDAFGSEDTGINFGIFAQPSVLDGSQSITVTVSNIPNGWTPVLTDPTTSNGTFNAANGTWTISLAPGQTLNSGPVFMPPLNSDVDISNPPISVSVAQTDIPSGTTQNATDTMNVVVDAVADPTNLSATDVTGLEDNPVALNIQTSLTDTDGSEQITEILISGVPSGFTLNAGTNQGGGVWSVPAGSLPSLQLTPPANYSGTVTLTVDVTNEEANLSDTEFDLTNNTNTNSTTFDVTFNSVPDAPSLIVNNPIVKEDGSIDLNISATLEDTDGSEYLVVRATGIDTANFTISNIPAGGTFDANTGVFEITLPAGQNFSGSLTFTPNPDSDIDNPNIQVTATAFETDTNAGSTVTANVEVITDAVADAPTIDAGLNTSVLGGQSVALNISNALTDTDGSETLGDVTISGVPAGYSLSAGTDNGNGTWTVTQAQLNGLMLNTPVNANGSVTLTASVTSTETNLSGNETDLTDNTATSSDTVTITVSPDVNPPLVTFGANGSGSAQVLEDGSVFVPITATLQGNAPQQLSVELTGVPSTWTIATGANNGTYNSATGTWTITLPANTNYNGGLTFTPPAGSDVDLTGLTVTAISTNTRTNQALTSNTPGSVIVDAVADMPTIDAGANSSVTAGSSVALNISNALTDTDGSESLGDVTISGVPAGYSLSAGTDNGNGTWTVTQAQLNGLMLNTPANGNGNVILSVSVTSTESVTDTDFDLTNNTATNTDTVVISVNPPLTPPQVTFGANGSGEAQVLEDGSVFVPITATLTGNAANQQLTVELTGVPSTWTITTGANNGSYNANTGTWTITLPANTNYNGGLTFMPPADSDVDLTGLTVTATSTNTTTNEVETASTPGQVIVDAVADTPVLNVNNANGTEGSSIALNISSALTDTDGSEVLSNVTISGLPAGFSLSAGTDLGGGVWEVTQAQLAGLQLNTPQNFSGSVPLTASVTTTEQVTDTDFDLTNNTATVTRPFNVVISDTANPPTLTVEGTHRVYEDGSVFVPFSATLTGDATEVLTVSVSNIDPSWTITTGANNGTYNAGTGVWTITLPAGTDYSGGLTFAPPANSDLDLTGLQVRANAFAPTTNTNSSVTEVIQIITDAVADQPNINAGADQTVTAGQSVALNITNSLTDTDGSESLGNVVISGIPAGYSLSAGTNLGNGSWSVTQAQLNGLTLNTPANGNGNISLTVTTTSTESVSDGEFDLTNNTASNSDVIFVTVNPDNQPPQVTFGANGSGSAQVLEDGSVFVPITATINGNAPQQLTVELTGVPSTWTVATGANNGTYNSATGTWTISLPANTNYNGGLTFTPPADSDVDLSGLTVTATSTNTTTNQSLTSNTPGSIIVDAVADMPTLNASNAAGEEGTTVALNISTSLTDTDGSEVLSNVTISGVPAGYSLTQGTQTSPGVWSVPVNQLGSLGLNVPNGATPGSFQLTASVTSTEQVTDTDFDLTNNTATNTQVLTVTVSPDDVPVIVTPSSPISYESQLGNPNVLTGTITADFGSDGPGTFCVPQGGNFTSTGAVASGGLASGGVPVVVNASGNTYTGTANGLVVFTLVINANGSYTFTQNHPIDHLSATNPNEIINLNFDFCARDNDGDVSVSILTVRVQDTGPTARPDAVTMYSCDWVTRGNVITNSNQNGNGADTLSVEDPTEVTAVDGKSFKEGGAGMVVHGDHGCLFIFKDGSYAYISNEANPKASHQENFSYTIADADGDIATANLNVSVIEQVVTSNPDADYGNQTIRGLNAYYAQEDGESNFYQTSLTDGAMVLGWTRNDELRGNIGDDVLLGWTGDDRLAGGAGNDILMGEQDNNTLTGGSGSDMFVIFNDKDGNNNKYDTITDFNLNQGDVLVLSDVISGFGSNSNIADFVRIVDTSGGKMVQVNTDGSGNDFFNVAKINNHSGIDINNLDVQQLFDQGHIDVA